MYDVIVVGAGAAGLSVTYWLQRAGVKCLMIERGTVGESWRRMPTGTLLLSPWWTNSLPEGRSSRFRAWDKVSSLEYADYLSWYATKYWLPVLENTRVWRVGPCADSAFLEIQTTGPTFRSRLLVCASGYFQNPVVPNFSGGHDGSIPSFHAGEYETPQKLREICAGPEKVLIVGKRISAGQLMHELHDAGFDVALSTRGEIEMRARWRMAPWKERLYFLYEALFVKLFSGVKGSSRPIMDGGRNADLLRTSKVRQVPSVKAVRNGSVMYESGSSEAFGAIVFATGYRPALGYLGSGLRIHPDNGISEMKSMESIQMPGVFFIGIENQRNFLSPYLRGIRSDARVLAGILLERLNR